MAPRVRPGRPRKIPDGLVEITLVDALNRFFDSFKDRVAKNTVASKRTVETVLLEQLGPKFKVWQLDRDLFTQLAMVLVEGSSVEERQQRLAEGRKVRRGRSTKQSQDQVRTTLKQFAKFCHQRDWLDGKETLIDEIVLGRKDVVDETPPREKLRKKPEEWAAILDEAERKHPRLRMALAIGIYMTRRISEVAWLTWGDIDWEERIIKFNNQKGGRLHVMPFRDVFIEELIRYRTWWTEHYGPPLPRQYVCPSKLKPSQLKGAGSHVRYRNGRAPWPMDPNRKATVQTLERENAVLLNRLGVDRTKVVAGTHTWRRSGATQIAVTNGMGAAQYALSHKSIVVTQEYTGNLDGQWYLFNAWQPGSTPPGGGDMRMPAPREAEEVMLAEVVELRPRRKVS